MSERVCRRPGNWKRHLCEWIGHENIGVRNLLYGTPEVMCLRCRGSSWTAPEFPPWYVPATTHPAPAATRPETPTTQGA